MSDEPQRYGDLGTPEQMQKGNRIFLGEGRGAVRKAYAKSMLDVLIENDLITETQKQYGEIYWRMKELAFPFLNISITPIYGDTPMGDNTVEDSIGSSLDGAMTEIWIILAGYLENRYKQVLMACCNSMIECMPLIIIQTCGEILIRQSFEALEKYHPIASRKFEDRVNKMLAMEMENV